MHALGQRRSMPPRALLHTHHRKAIFLVYRVDGLIPRRTLTRTPFIQHPAHAPYHCVLACQARSAWTPSLPSTNTAAPIHASRFVIPSPSPISHPRPSNHTVVVPHLRCTALHIVRISGCCGCHRRRRPHGDSRSLDAGRRECQKPFFVV